MATWNGADPAPLAPLTVAQRLRGGVRLVLFLVLMLLAMVVFLIGRTFRGWFGRRVTFHFAVVRVWARGCLALMGLRLVVRGRLITSGAIVANHASWLDIMAVRATGLVYFVSKDDVASWPGVGFIARVSGTVFIERRRTEAKRQERVLLDRIAARQVLCIFPEGTSTDGLRVLPFKSSLFSAFFVDGAEDSVLIQPVTIRYHVAPGSGLPDSFYGWWGTMGFEPHVWNVLCRSRGGRVSVTFHDAVRPRDLGTRKTLAEHCGRTVAEALPVA